MKLIYYLAPAALAATVLAGAVTSLYAGTPLNAQMKSLVDSYLTEARKTDPSLKGFSADEGKKLFNSKHTHSAAKEQRSCSGCHTADPGKPGKTPVGKVIDPLSPAVTKERFTDPRKVEKWFKRNCEYVLERECTPVEKGDFITYMISL